MAKKFEKIGENLEVKNIVIHQLLKDAGNRLVNPKAADNLLTIGEKEKTFLGNLDKSYHKKSSPIYGIFAEENPKFRDCLIDYINGDCQFYDFSINVMNHYKIVLENTVAATGGYMIICEYRNIITSNDLLLILMINNKEGFVIDEKSLTLDNIKNLDLSKVDVACLINLTEWVNIENNLPSERKTYLSFVKGMKEVSYYFMSFIDVDNKNTSTESTKRLITAIEAYADIEQWDRNTKINKKNKVFTYCHDCIDNKKEILLSTISSILNPDNPEHFQDFATEEAYRVSEIISGDKARMKFLKTITYSDKEFKIEFDTKLILDNTIVLDSSGNKLTIKNISPILRDKIKELSNKNA
ncbi:nucleoid-associated protein [Chryseobacterium indologenes]|uniref:nucleoid-associated protein n=1 Tax=Chryseobacterium indologenes TaxID=253 RepID=UPI001F4B3266|nr:nucleoid-associated protein [Chryseobacterium indologenes]